MALDDMIDSEIGMAVAATAAAVSPRARGLIRQGAVYGLAGAMKAGDVVFGAARGIVRGAASGVNGGGSSSGSRSSGSSSAARGSRSSSASRRSSGSRAQRSTASRRSSSSRSTSRRTRSSNG